MRLACMCAAARVKLWHPTMLHPYESHILQPTPDTTLAPCLMCASVCSEHVRIIDEINFGNGLPEMRTWKQAEDAGKAVGFNLVTRYAHTTSMLRDRDCCDLGTRAYRAWRLGCRARSHAVRFKVAIRGLAHAPDLPSCAQATHAHTLLACGSGCRVCCLLLTAWTWLPPARLQVAGMAGWRSWHGRTR